MSDKLCMKCQKLKKWITEVFKRCYLLYHPSITIDNNKITKYFKKNYQIYKIIFILENGVVYLETEVRDLQRSEFNHDRSFNFVHIT